MRIFLAALLAFILAFFDICEPGASLRPPPRGHPRRGPWERQSFDTTPPPESTGVRQRTQFSSVITADRIGNIYVSEHEGKRISQFSPAGVNLMTITTPITGWRPSARMERSTSASTRPARSISTGNWGRSRPVLFQPRCLWPTTAFDAGGNLYVTGSPRGCWTHFANGCGLGGFRGRIPGTAGIASDADGNMYVASFNNNIVEKQFTSGTDLGTFAWMGPERSIAGIALRRLRQSLTWRTSPRARFTNFLRQTCSRSLYFNGPGRLPPWIAGSSRWGKSDRQGGMQTGRLAIVWLLHESR